MGIARSVYFAADLRDQGSSSARGCQPFRATVLSSHTRKAIDRVLGETGLPAECLELEITESMMMGNTEKVLRILSELKEMKVQLAVDDFGTGYSSLGYLRRFPIDRLKIDRSFIDDVPASQHDSTIAKAIVSLAHNLGLQRHRGRRRDARATRFSRAKRLRRNPGLSAQPPPR